MASRDFSRDCRNSPQHPIQLESAHTHVQAHVAEDESVCGPHGLVGVSADPSESSRSLPLGELSPPGFQGSQAAERRYDPLLTPEQVAARLNVSPDWVRDHSGRKRPRLPVIRLGGGPGRAGLLRYRASDIEKFIHEMAQASQLQLQAV
jgi:hypothetical protein